MFKSKDDLYTVWAIKNTMGEGVYELTFNTKRLRTLTSKSMGEKDKHNVFEVIATVKAIYKKWFKKYKPEYVKFGVLDSPKARVNIFKRMLEEFGYEIVPNKGLLFKRTKK